MKTLLIWGLLSTLVGSFEAKDCADESDEKAPEITISGYQETRSKLLKF